MKKSIVAILLFAGSAAAQTMPAQYDDYDRAFRICTQPDHLASKVPLTFRPQYAEACQKVVDWRVSVHDQVRAFRDAARAANNARSDADKKAAHVRDQAARASATPAPAGNSDDAFLVQLVGTPK